ncbi:uncharacterized protein LACBIDRAFT_299075 [Laccaria bicolor S238N-H82]|uniref:Predicted protein n=1 Tax=Laccaria bicolor (strain S238N-H82 / ATCC MYA-4686) TaxID=486041 RepID=B0DDZ1_LACBS|nr:uncharacterized protein LACBIDRAFT_299075 [Laccaria bicolor S238N-H82]EDR07171.1 predicted protein [Laccaria bicolor S238N-H82]|eukprot:XP_001882102.1 predicted protein [Laccaria bicolor S238N-H82]
MLALFDYYPSNTSSTLPLDALNVAVFWSQIWFEEFHLLEQRSLGRPLALLKRGLPPINITVNGTLDAQLHSTLARTRGKRSKIPLGWSLSQL